MNFDCLLHGMALLGLGRGGSQLGWWDFLAVGFQSNEQWPLSRVEDSWKENCLCSKLLSWRCCEEYTGGYPFLQRFLAFPILSTVVRPVQATQVFGRKQWFPLWRDRSFLFFYLFLNNYVVTKSFPRIICATSCSHTSEKKAVRVHCQYKPRLWVDFIFHTLSPSPRFSSAWLASSGSIFFSRFILVSTPWDRRWEEMKRA